jgi:hypothetical protein
VCSVIIGSNRIINCQTLIGVRGRPLVQVSHSPLRLSLTLPPTYRGNPIKLSYSHGDDAVGAKDQILPKFLSISYIVKRKMIGLP